MLNEVVLNQVLFRFESDERTRPARRGAAQRRRLDERPIWDGRQAIRISVSNWQTTPRTTSTAPVARSLVDRRVLGHQRDHAVHAALVRAARVPRGRPRGSGKSSGAGRRLDDPRRLLELRLELARPPAGVAGEHPHAAGRRPRAGRSRRRRGRSRRRRRPASPLPPGRRTPASTSTADSWTGPADVDALLVRRRAAAGREPRRRPQSRKAG